MYGSRSSVDRRRIAGVAAHLYDSRAERVGVRQFSRPVAEIVVDDDDRKSSMPSRPAGSESSSAGNTAALLNVTMTTASRGSGSACVPLVTNRSKRSGVTLTKPLLRDHSEFVQSETLTGLQTNAPDDDNNVTRRFHRSNIVLVGPRRGDSLRWIIAPVKMADEKQRCTLSDQMADARTHHRQTSLGMTPAALPGQ